MNDAILYLYAADVVGGLGVLAFMILLLSGIAGAVLLGMYVSLSVDSARNDNEPPELTEEEQQLLAGNEPRGDGFYAYRRAEHKRNARDIWLREQSQRAVLSCFAIRACVVASLSAIVVIASPSQNTMYAAAAISVGKDIAETPTAQKAVRALDAWLDKQLAPKEQSK